jgi:hypothetical protein
MNRRGNNAVTGFIAKINPEPVGVYNMFVPGVGTGYRIVAVALGFLRESKGGVPLTMIFGVHLLQ